MALPLEVTEVTASWLGAALAEQRPSVVVESVQATSVIWGTATKVFLDVSYATGASAGLPGRLCVKGGFRPELRPLMGVGYQTEARFYRDLAPRLGLGAPLAYYAGVDEASDQGIVVLDDLRDRGATFCDARRPLPPDQAAGALEALAVCHGSSAPDVAWLARTPFVRTMVQGLLVPDHWDAALAQPGSDAVRELLRDRGRVVDAFDRLWALEDGAPRALLHGDANLTNVYLDADGRPHLVDWQFASLGDPFHDVGLLLIGALSVADRRAHEEELLRGYLGARASHGGDPPPSWEDAWLGYRQHTLHGALYALTPEEMQPAEVREPLADRFAQAALDHDTFGLLGV